MDSFLPSKGLVLVNTKGEERTGSSLSTCRYVGLYFSAHWCPPCRQFTPKLVQAYSQFKQHKAEILFVSADHNQLQFDAYLADMPWLTVKYHEDKLREAISTRFKAQSIPMLVWVDARTGQVLTTEGRQCVETGVYPWHPAFAETETRRGGGGGGALIIIIKLLVVAFVLLAGVVVTPVGDLVPFIRGTMPVNHLLSPFEFTDKDIPNLSGRRFLITGANSGIGFGTTAVLLRHGASVTMACRDELKCHSALLQLQSNMLKPSSSSSTQELKCVKLNLSSLRDVKRFADEYVIASSSDNNKLDSLVLNAGVMFTPHELTEDGLETQWGVNYVSHYLLARLLLPAMKPQSTIVSLSSNLHYLALGDANIANSLVFSEPQGTNRMRQYGRAKLGNLLFAQELARRLSNSAEHAGIVVTSLHPGGVRGELMRSMPGPLYPLARLAQHLLFWTEEEAALTVIKCAAAAWTGGGSSGISGKYFVPVGRVDNGSSQARNATLARLWYDQTETWLGGKALL